MSATKTMTFDLTDLSRRADAARGYIPLRTLEPGPGARARKALLVAIGVAVCSTAGLIALLFLSAILDF